MVAYNEKIKTADSRLHELGNTSMETISILIPCYNNEQTIAKTLASCLTQLFPVKFEILVSDNFSTDNTVKIVEKFAKRFTTLSSIRLLKSDTNIGCGGNLNKLIENCNTDLILFMSADDILTKSTYLLEVWSLLHNDNNAGIITRPYYWFTNNVGIPVRARPIKLNFSQYEILQSFDQISGIAIRKKFINNKFSNEYFIEMASVCFEVARKHRTIYVHEYPVAIRIWNNCTNPKLFEKSPLMAWYSLVKDYPRLVRYIASNYIGLVQIKNYGTMKQLLREIWYMIKLKPLNLFIPQFWFFVLGTILIPRRILRMMVEWWRNKK